MVRLLSPDLIRELMCCSVLAVTVKPWNAPTQQTLVCVAGSEPLGRSAVFMLFPCLNRECKT